MAAEVILEGIVTTLNPDRSVNIAPMGPWVDGDFRQLELRPFEPSTTLDNLDRTRQGVFHVTDDVLLFAEAVVGQLSPRQDLEPARQIEGRVIRSACRWYEFRVGYVDRTATRAVVSCQVVHVHRGRDFLGFNRAKHAVIEAAITATRVDWLPAEEVARQLDQLQRIVDKTGGEQERSALQLLVQHVQRHVAQTGS